MSNPSFLIADLDNFNRVFQAFDREEDARAAARSLMLTDPKRRVGLFRLASTFEIIPVENQAT